MKRAVLLINIGTPDQPSKKEVRRYLREFLNDPFVIDIPALGRLLLVNLIIIPFRVNKSTALYRRLWTPEGSPLLIYLQGLELKLQALMKEEARVYSAMRYGSPSLKKTLAQISREGYDELVVLPLFPQYANSTTGSIIHAVEKRASRMSGIRTTRFVHQFYHHPTFLEAFARRIRSYKPAEFDHVLFSFHSLPIRQVEAQHPGRSCEGCSCEHTLPYEGVACYKAACYETARQLASNCGIDNYSVAFQSRFAKKWISPFSDHAVIDLARQGKKRVLVAAPSFVADCLETVVEIGLDYNELFRNEGGEQLVLVESLNDDPLWVEALREIIVV